MVKWVCLQATMKSLTAGASSREKQQLLRSGWGDEEASLADWEGGEVNPHYDAHRYEAYSQQTRSNLVGCSLRRKEQKQGSRS